MNYTDFEFVMTDSIQYDSSNKVIILFFNYINNNDNDQLLAFQIDRQTDKCIAISVTMSNNHIDEFLRSNVPDQELINLMPANRSYWKKTGNNTYISKSNKRVRITKLNDVQGTIWFYSDDFKFYDSLVKIGNVIPFNKTKCYNYFYNSYLSMNKDGGFSNAIDNFKSGSKEFTSLKFVNDEKEVQKLDDFLNKVFYGIIQKFSSSDMKDTKNIMALTTAKEILRIELEDFGKTYKIYELTNNK